MIFTDGGHSDFVSGPNEKALYDLLCRRFEQLARQAIAALGFRFADASRAVGCWLDLLKQENQHLKGWVIRRLCFESAEFCAELKTRALERNIAPQTAEDTLWAVAPRTDLADRSASTDELTSTEAMPQISEQVGSPEMALPASDPTSGLRAREWEEIEIRFLSDERVQIAVGKDTETRNYAEFGFEDGRSKKPNRAWAALRLLADQGGTLRQAIGSQDWTIVEKRMQAIRKVFRDHFKLGGDPVPFVEGTGYRARFKIACAPSFNS